MKLFATPIISHLLYVFLKFFVYSLYCFLLNKFIVEKYSFIKILGIGGFRTLLGALFGGLVFIAFEVMPVSVLYKDDWVLYLLIYVPVRVIEWGVVVTIFFNKRNVSLNKKLLWVLGGIILSILVDLIFAPSGLRIGRILC